MARFLGLGGGGLPKGWGVPSRVFDRELGNYVRGGKVWWGKDPATREDRAALKLAAPNAEIDELSVCGTRDPAWTTFRQEFLKQQGKQVVRLRWVRRLFRRD